jgi:hypothetical protein
MAREMVRRLDPQPAADDRALGRELPWAVAVVLLATAPLLALLASGHTLACFDSARLYAPLRALVSEALRAGRLPLWNPYEATGMPLFAQGLHGVLHPWSLLAAALAPGDGVDLMIVLHVATGALGAALLARALGLARIPAAMAGMAYGLSGYVLSMSDNLAFLAGSATAPWAIAALAGVAKGDAWRLPAAAIAVAAAHLAGDPQWVLVAVAIGALLSWDAGGWRTVAICAAAVVAGTAVAAVQLVPSWFYFQRSARHAGLGGADRLQWALAPWRIVELAAPGLFASPDGTLDAPVFRWLGGPSQYARPFARSIAVGAPVLWLAALGVAAGRTGRLLGAVALALLWLALGHHLGAAHVTGWIPVGGSIRYSETLVGPLTLALAVLAGVGVDALLAGRVRPRARSVAVAAVVALAAAAAAALAEHRPPPPGVPVDGWTVGAGRLSVGLVQAGAGLLAIAGLLLAARRWRLAPRWVGVGLATVVVVDGVAASRFALHGGQPGVRDRAPLTALHQVETVPRVVSLENAALWEPPGLDDVDGAVFALSRIGAASFAVASRVDQINTYTGVEPARVVGLLRSLLALGPGQLLAFRRYSVTHAVTPADVAPADALSVAAATQGGRVVGVDRAAHLEIWALPHRPWASFAQGVRSVRDDEEAARAVVELERAADPAVALVGPAPPLAPGTVLDIERQPEHVRVVAESSGNGLLVIADADWPGWEATIDGQPVEIRVADGLVRAVAWPAGRHVLEMAYRPAEVGVGVAVSVVGLLLVAALSFVPMAARVRRGT